MIKVGTKLRALVDYAYYSPVIIGEIIEVTQLQDVNGIRFFFDCKGWQYVGRLFDDGLEIFEVVEKGDLIIHDEPVERIETLDPITKQIMILKENFTINEIVAHLEGME